MWEDKPNAGRVTMKLSKLLVAVPIAGILAGIGMGISAASNGAFSDLLGAPESSVDESTLTATPAAEPPSGAPLDETILAVYDGGALAAIAAQREADAAAQAAADAAAVEAAAAEAEATANANSTKKAAPADSGASTGESTPDQPASTWQPWETYEYAVGDTGGFCAGLNSLRASVGSSALASCGQGSAVMGHAYNMAVAQTIWHDASRATRPEVVGYSWTLQRIIDGPNGFINSPGHMAVITDGGAGTSASVGCYNSVRTSQKTEGGALSKQVYIFCVARFTY